MQCVHLKPVFTARLVFYSCILVPFLHSVHCQALFMQRGASNRNGAPSKLFPPTRLAQGFAESEETSKGEVGTPVWFGICGAVTEKLENEKEGKKQRGERIRERGIGREFQHLSTCLICPGC